MKLLLFDVDQTLIYTGGAGLRALDRACRKHLAVENATEGISAHGKTDPAIIREILLARVGSDSTLEIQLQSILESYLLFLREEVQLSPGYRVLPGIVEILREMSAQTGVVIGLATGNVEVGARIKLDRGNLNPYFTFGGFGGFGLTGTGPAGGVGVSYFMRPNTALRFGLQARSYSRTMTWNSLTGVAGSDGRESGISVGLAADRPKNQGPHHHCG